MKFSHKLSDAVHLLAYIEIFPDDDLSSRAIARSIVTNPSMVRSLMMDLRKAGFLKTKQGSAEPELAKSRKRSASTISSRQSVWSTTCCTLMKTRSKSVRLAATFKGRRPRPTRKWKRRLLPRCGRSACGKLSIR